jgi:radical SAM-linked protein
MAYSSGFSPHPRISYATASPTGAASEAEYLEIALSAVCVPELVARELDAALPDGLDVLAVVEAGPGSLADQLTGSVWQIDLRDIEPQVVAPAVEAFLAADTAVTERMTKNGLRSFDARESVVSLQAEGAVLRVVTRHLTPLVRPDDVLSAMARITPGFAPQNPLITRLEQGTLDEAEQVVAPF